MTDKTYARVQDGVVVELFSTASDISELFNPALIWIDIGDNRQVREGWQYDGTSFSPPPPAAPPSAPSLAQLQAQLAALSAQVAALAKS